MSGRIYLTAQKEWKPGDLPTMRPDDYLGWHEWADVQHKAGLRQKECGGCGRWKYPQELTDAERTFNAITSRGETVKQTYRVCLACVANESSKESPNV